MSSISNSNLLIAAQLYGGASPAAKARREPVLQDFATELEPRAKDRQPRQANPTLTPPKAPEPMAPAKRFDEGAGRRDPLPAAPVQKEQAPAPRIARPGSQLNILV
jgi:hypothetical protein